MMRLHFLSAAKLSEDLVQERLSLRDKAYYVLGGSIFGIILSYSTLTFANASRTWLGLYELLLLLFITVYGFERCYNASSGDNNKSFISDFVCLAVPISVTTTIVAWGVYWGGWYLYQHVVTAISFESQHAAKLLLWINNELPWPTVLITVVVSNGIFYLRMATYLKRIAACRSQCIAPDIR
jgi:hypothetical protein